MLFGLFFGLMVVCLGIFCFGLGYLMALLDRLVEDIEAMAKARENDTKSDSVLSDS